MTGNEDLASLAPSARRQRSERPRHEHRLVRAHGLGASVGGVVRIVDGELVGVLAEVVIALDDPRQARRRRAEAERIGLVLGAQVGDDHVQGRLIP